MILSFYEKNRKDTRQNTTKVNENQEKKEDLSKTFQQEQLLTCKIHDKLHCKEDGFYLMQYRKERAQEWRLTWDIRRLIGSYRNGDSFTC